MRAMFAWRHEPVCAGEKTASGDEGLLVGCHPQSGSEKQVPFHSGLSQSGRASLRDACPLCGYRC